MENIILATTNNIHLPVHAVYLLRNAAEKSGLGGAICVFFGASMTLLSWSRVLINSREDWSETAGAGAGVFLQRNKTHTHIHTHDHDEYEKKNRVYVWVHTLGMAAAAVGNDGKPVDVALVDKVAVSC